jgi:predicted aconitase
MTTIKNICISLIGPMNYKQDTKSLTEEVYKEFGVDLARTSGTALLHGTAKTPKLMSVIRRIQIVKKSVAKKMKKLEVEKD